MKCLIVRPPFAKYIVDGIKTIEYRSRKTNIRGRIGIIESGTSTIIGDVKIIDCTYNPDIHLWEWKLSSPNKYYRSIRIKRKKGAIIWEDIDFNPDDYMMQYEKPAMYNWNAYKDEEECHKLEQKFIKEYVRRTYGLDGV